MGRYNDAVYSIPISSARWFIISIVPPALQPSPRDFLSFLVSGFVRLCQNGDGACQRGPTTGRFSLISLCFRASRRSTVFSLFSSISYPIRCQRGRENCSALVHCYCLFALAHRTRFPAECFHLAESRIAIDTARDADEPVN